MKIYQAVGKICFRNAFFFSLGKGKVEVLQSFIFINVVLNPFSLYFKCNFCTLKVFRNSMFQNKKSHKNN